MRATRSAAVSLAFSLVLFACGSETTSEAHPPALHDEAADELTETLEPVEDSLARFTTVDACIAELREKVPPEVLDAVQDLGYSALFRDVCGSRRAAREGDATLCDELTVRPLRHSCRLRVATLHRDPEACPRHGDERRDPLCLAWASRIPGLCAAARGTDEERCRAVFRQAPERCPDVDPSSTHQCRADIVRYGAVVADGVSRAEEARRVRHEAELRLGDESSFPVSGRPGIVLGAEGCGLRLQLSTPPAVPGGRRTPGLELDLRLPAELSRTVELSIDGVRNRVAVTGVESLGLPLVSGEVHLQPVELNRGAPLSLRLQGRVRRRGELVEVRFDLTSFVLDFSPPECG
ncbi:MAG: hypothetical protein AAGF12_01950 [Myxococcota bacterium]